MSIYTPLALPETWQDRLADMLAPHMDEVCYVAGTAIIGSALVLAAVLSI